MALVIDCASGGGRVFGFCSGLSVSVCMALYMAEWRGAEFLRGIYGGIFGRITGVVFGFCSVIFILGLDVLFIFLYNGVMLG